MKLLKGFRTNIVLLVVLLALVVFAVAVFILPTLFRVPQEMTVKGIVIDIPVSPNFPHEEGEFDVQAEDGQIYSVVIPTIDSGCARGSAYGGFAHLKIGDTIEVYGKARNKKTVVPCFVLHYLAIFDSQELYEKEEYKNVEQGFTMQYPRDWKVEERIDSVTIRHPQYVGSHISVRKINVPEDQSFKSFAETRRFAHERIAISPKTEIIRFVGVDVYRFDTSLPPPNYAFEMYIPDRQKLNNEAYVISGGSDVREHTKIVEDILSSFRFIEPQIIQTTEEETEKNVQFPYNPCEPDQIPVYEGGEFSNCVDVTESPSGETADWQIYRNEEFGFEIKYPPLWKANLWQVTDSDMKVSFNIGDSISEESIVVGKTDITLEEWKAELGTVPDGFFREIRDFELDGEKAIRVRLEAGFGNFITIVASHNGKLYAISTSGYMLENEMLSTFRFIE